eukprot:2237815-Pleurochrysis_carterae.AAC.1
MAPPKQQHGSLQNELHMETCRIDEQSKRSHNALAAMLIGRSILEIETLIGFNHLLCVRRLAQQVARRGCLCYCCSPYRGRMQMLLLCANH